MSDQIKKISIKKSMMGENEMVMKSISWNKLGIQDVEYVAEFKDYFGFQDKRGNKILIHSCTGNKTVLAAEMFFLPSGHIRIVNPVDKRNGKILYTNDLENSTDLHSSIMIFSESIIGKYDSKKIPGKEYKLNCKEIKRIVLQER